MQPTPVEPSWTKNQPPDRQTEECQSVSQPWTVCRQRPTCTHSQKQNKRQTQCSAQMKFPRILINHWLSFVCTIVPVIIISDPCESPGTSLVSFRPLQRSRGKGRARNGVILSANVRLRNRKTNKRRWPRGGDEERKTKPGWGRNFPGLSIYQ